MCWVNISPAVRAVAAVERPRLDWCAFQHRLWLYFCDYYYRRYWFSTQTVSSISILSRYVFWLLHFSYMCSYPCIICTDCHVFNLVMLFLPVCHVILPLYITACTITTRWCPLLPIPFETFEWRTGVASTSVGGDMASLQIRHIAPYVRWSPVLPT